MEKIKFIDLFAGMGGTRIGFEQACEEHNLQAECVFTSEIKPHAVNIYEHNFSGSVVYGDITKIDETKIPDFDFLLGGFPCQAFSNAGKRAGFEDARGTLFFDIARIIKEKKPKGFLLENVEGLVSHDRENSSFKVGRTLKTILSILEGMGYNTSWKVLDSKNFGIPQSRKRIYIVGILSGDPLHNNDILLDNFPVEKKFFMDIRVEGLHPLETKFTQKLLEIYNPTELGGKSITDKRGGVNNIHSWDLELSGAVDDQQKYLMSTILLERRKKKWAERKGIVWMDGMPLTLDEIHSFYHNISKGDLKTMLDDLVFKKYLRFEHPKDLVGVSGGKKRREYATHVERGYNIVTGKLSFELTKILGGDSVSPTIVATEVDRIGVVDNGKLRRVGEREYLRFFGFPESYSSNINHKELYDLIGNTVVVPVIKSVVLRVLSSLQ